MKRNPKTEPTAMAKQISKETREHEAAEAEYDAEDESAAASLNILNSSSDVCKALMERYAKSSAPQHRHLIATAAAMRSILIEEGLPLTPPAFFAAAITAFRDSNHSDTDSTAALAAFLSILLSLDSIVVPPHKARDAAFVLAAFLKDSPPSSSLVTGTVRSLIKSLGLLVLRVDLEDWSAVELPLETLLMFSVDKRPKVRRCAQVCVEKVFKTLRGSVVIKKASKVVHYMYKKYIPMAKELISIELSDVAQSKMLSKSEHMEILHMLNVLIIIVPNLSEKVRMKILSDVYKLLDCRFSWLTRHIFRLLEALLECSKVEVLVSESENLFSALTSYVSLADKNPIDAVISASALLKTGLNKLHGARPSIWMKYLPLIFTSVAGYLNSDANTSKHAEDILKELINVHIDRSLFLITSQSCNYEKEDTPETIAITSVCAVFDKMLGACEIPTEYVLTVISVLFLKLGEFSYFFMKDILLKLSQKAIELKEDLPNMKHLEACIGTAVIAMGPEKVLSLIPISLNADKVTCSNTWMIPILKKYVIGASLQYFMEHIVPLAKSVQNACKKVKKAPTLKGLQSCFCGLWDLLPAFCRYPSDISQTFEVLSKLFIAVLKEDPSLHGTIAKALQELVNGNRSIIRPNQDANHCADLPTSFIFNDFNMESLLCRYSKKTASKNMKALACSSMDLFRTLTEIFFDSPSENRSYLKEAIGCLASVIGSENIKYFFVSSLEKCESIDALTESRKLEGQIQEGNVKEEGEKTVQKEACEKMRCLVMELASSFVEAADKDLINLFFDYIRSFLLAIDGACQNEAYYTLNRILEEHSWFCSERIDDLTDLLFSIKSPVDSMILENRFSCFHYLLVHILKSNDEDMNTKAFLILNEIIITLKSKKESRKLAYDMLLNISCSLKTSQSTNAESDLQRLLNMVMGYLSSSSPHIMSGAISALSLLIYNDAGFCLTVPNLIPSVLTLLQNKAIEVIKAALGFIKVLVSSLHSNNLMKLLSDILNGILHWSSVSKYHFRSKVGIILEILIRKCGSDAVDTIVPEKYKGFVKTVEEGRQSKKNPKGLPSSNIALESADSVLKRGQKRALRDVLGPQEKHSKATFNNFQKGKRRKKEEDISSTNKETSQTGGKRVRSQSANRAVPRYSESLFKTRFRGIDKKRNVDKQSGGNQIIKTKNKKADSKKKFNNASAASKSAAASKSNKHRGGQGNPRHKKFE